MMFFIGISHVTQAEQRKAEDLQMEALCRFFRGTLVPKFVDGTVDRNAKSCTARMVETL